MFEKFLAATCTVTLTAHCSAHGKVEVFIPSLYSCCGWNQTTATTPSAVRSAHTTLTLLCPSYSALSLKVIVGHQQPETQTSSTLKGQSKFVPEKTDT